mgnify:CR=1 FL=1
MKKKSKDSEENVRFIKDNFFRMTDAEIAKTLEMSVSLVRKIRQREGLAKTHVRSIKTYNERKENAQEYADDVAAVELGDKAKIGEILTDTRTREEIEKLFNRMFKNTEQFKILQQTYSEEEVRYYLQEFNALYSEIKSQGGSLTTSEYRNVDQYIQLTLRRNRLTKEERNVITDIQAVKGGMQIDELSEEQKSTIYQLNNQIKDVGRNIKEINEQLIRIQDSLDMSRKERLKRMTDNQSGIPRIIQEMQDSKQRDEISIQAALMREATEKLKARYKKEGIIMETEAKKD